MQRGVGHMEVKAGAPQTGMPQQQLDAAQVNTGFEQMRRTSVPTLIDTLLMIRRWPRSGTCTIPSADKR